MTDDQNDEHLRFYVKLVRLTRYARLGTNITSRPEKNYKKPKLAFVFQSVDEPKVYLWKVVSWNFADNSKLRNLAFQLGGRQIIDHREIIAAPDTMKIYLDAQINNVYSAIVERKSHDIKEIILEKRFYSEIGGHIK